MMTGKTDPLYRNILLKDYSEKIDLAFSFEHYNHARSSFTPVSVMELNAMVKAILEEQLYMHLMISWMNDARFNLVNGVRTWQATLGVDENQMQLPTVTKNFYNWRRRNYPNAIRKRGHFHNNPVNISFYA